MTVATADEDWMEIVAAAEAGRSMDLALVLAAGNPPLVGAVVVNSDAAMYGSRSLRPVAVGSCFQTT